MSSLQRICVYCGSSPGRDPRYLQAATALAQVLVGNGMQLVYGGAGIGLMGAVADQVLAMGGEVIGVIPQALAQKEVMHANLSQLYITQTMHERKMRMAELADGFIALPGGIGTLEELFEIWTWAQLGFHHKPCGLLNVGGFYDPLLQFLDHITAEQFVRPQHRQLLSVDSDATALLRRMQEFEAPPQPVWLQREEI